MYFGRTTAVTTGRKLLQALDLDKYFKYKEIYPGSKVAHFKRYRARNFLLQSLDT